MLDISILRFLRKNLSSGDAWGAEATPGLKKKENFFGCAHDVIK